MYGSIKNIWKLRKLFFGNNMCAWLRCLPGKNSWINGEFDLIFVIVPVWNHAIYKFYTIEADEGAMFRVVYFHIFCVCDFVKMQFRFLN